MPSPRIAEKVGLLPSPAFIPGRRERERTPPNPASGATNSTAIGRAEQPTQAGPGNEGFRLVSGHKGIRGIDHPATTGEFASRERKGTGSNMAGGPDRSASPPVTQAGAVMRYNGSRPEHGPQLQTHAQTQTPAEAYALAYGGTSRRASRVSGPAYLAPTSGVTRATVTTATPDAVATIATTATATPTPTPATGRDSMWMTMDQHVREHSSKGRKRVAEKAKERELGPNRGRERDKEKDRDKDSHTHGGVLVSKPIFEWITRKLGAGRRATITGASDTGRGSQADPVNIGGPSRLPPRYQDMTVTANVTQRARRIDAGRAIDEMGMTREDSEQPAVAISPTSVPVPIRQTRSTHYHDLPAPYRSTISPATPPRTRIGPTPHPARPQLSPTQIFPPVRDRMSVVSRSETLSLRSYRLASPSERERRREANNPYPSIPMPLLHRGSIMTTTTDAPSMSFLSRSISRDGSVATSMRSIRSGRSGRSAISARSYSGRSGRSIRTGSIRSVEVRRRSIASSLRPSLSILERRRREGGPLGYGNSYRDGSFYANRDSLSRSRSRGLSQTLGGPSIHTPSIVDHPLSHRSDPIETTPVIGTDPANGCYTPALADEDASIRPFPPSHPNSPTPSPSIISRTSRSASDALGSRPTPSQSQAGMSGVHMVEEAGSIEATPHPAGSSNGRLPDGPGMPDVLSGSAPVSAVSPESGSPRRVVIARSPSGSSAPTSVSGRSRQGSCSTRPTTVRSFDSGPGVAHIALAPGIAFAPVPNSPLDPTVSAETGLVDEIHSPSAAQGLGVPTATALPTYFHPAAPQHAHHGHTAIAVSSPLRETVSSGSSGTTSPVSPVSDAHGSPSSIAAIPPTSPANIDESAAPTPLAALSPARSALEIENDTITSPIGSAGHEPLAPPPVNTNTTAPPPVSHTAASQRYSVQAPRHTPHHPFFNPHPSATPAANASTLTLASSTFAQGPARPTSVSRLSLLSNGPSVHGSLVPHRASLPGQNVTWAEERDEDANSAGDAVADSEAVGGPSGTGSGSGVRRSSEPLSRSPRLGEIRDMEDDTTTDQSHLPRRPAPQLAAPFAPLAPTTDTLHSPLQAHTLSGHRPPSIAPSTYSFHSSEPYHYNNAHGYNYNYNRPGSVFGATTGTSFKTTHTGWTGASASASASAWALRFGPGVGAGADEEASMRAIRRRGSAGSMESFESRWSWAPARGVVVQGRGDGVSA